MVKEGKLFIIVIIIIIINHYFHYVRFNLMKKRYPRIELL